MIIAVDFDGTCVTQMKHLYSKISCFVRTGYSLMIPII